MSRILENVSKAQDLMNKIGPHMSAEDQLWETRNILSYVLSELADLLTKVDAISKR